MSFVIKTPSRPPPSQGEEHEKAFIPAPDTGKEQTLSDVTARTDLNHIPF
jgi:hypothetical protein